MLQMTEWVTSTWYCLPILLYNNYASNFYSGLVNYGTWLLFSIYRRLPKRQISSTFDREFYKALSLFRCMWNPYDLYQYILNVVSLVVWLVWHCYLFLKVDIILLEDAAKIMPGDSQNSTALRSNWFYTLRVIHPTLYYQYEEGKKWMILSLTIILHDYAAKVRRLYDIANVLSSINLIEKVKVDKQLTNTI